MSTYLETKRLILKAHELSDIDNILALRNTMMVEYGLNMQSIKKTL